ncbi:hypothetical protein M9H77_03742 [Catharanthus roseus]|uniref:Uncharacterized protein n=1 Tax=Catharanthus roseus TaxID=4058 RepID=A0ACC0CCJ6_CATRO|nr:hypothetical protein M9H77_03742 [Catharanthus roseus]
MKNSFRLGLKFGKNQVNGHVSGLHCTWSVPRTGASSDDVDGFLTLRVDPLEEGHSTLRVWPNRYLCGYRIILCGGTVPQESVAYLTSDMGVRLFVIERSYRNLVPMSSIWGSRPCPWSPTVALHVLLNLGRRSCTDAQQATEVLGQDELASDSEMTPEPERVAPAVAGNMGTFVADSLPVAASPTPILLDSHYHHYFGVGSGRITFVAIVCVVSSGLRLLDSRLWS